MPKSKNIEKDIESIMAPFDENCDPEAYSGNTFWDFYIIGGRWAGTKERCGCDPDKLEQFLNELKKRNVTVSGLQCGKQKLSPESQIPMVDELWCEFFPTESGEIVHCPIFSHSNNQYDSNDLISCDICLVEDIPKNLTCSRVIIGGPSYDEANVEANFMLSDSIWNGVNFENTKWDGNVLTAIEMFKDKSKGYKKEYIERSTPKNDWICVTVDYHN
jgi:hypothetical protein